MDHEAWWEKVVNTPHMIWCFALRLWASKSSQEPA
jgi:hypothetical protein